ncbi:MAG: fibronectin type III domain-containing protein [Saprospiraceae bacterium]|nr:fibronectin type III domain-containing protein [Saprospiraceae bacterium]
MRKISSKAGSVLVAIALFAAVLTQPSHYTCLYLPSPYDLGLAMPSSNHASFSWDSNEQGASYKVWYYREGDNYTSTERTTSNLYIDYTNLPAGTYTFYFVTICGGGTSQSIVYDDIIVT